MRMFTGTRCTLTPFTQFASLLLVMKNSSWLQLAVTECWFFPSSPVFPLILCKEAAHWPIQRGLIPLLNAENRPVAQNRLTISQGLTKVSFREKLMVVGTTNGEIFVILVEGIDSLLQMQVVRPSLAKIVSVKWCPSIFFNSELLAVCSEDQKVFLFYLEEGENPELKLKSEIAIKGTPEYLIWQESPSKFFVFTKEKQKVTIIQEEFDKWAIQQ